MKVIVFQGGLGNQLFQYAYYRHLRNQFSRECIRGYYPKRALKAHNGLEINRWFDVELPSHSVFSDMLAAMVWYPNKMLRKVNCRLVFTNNDWQWNERKFLHDGFWQNERFVTADTIPRFRDDLMVGQENADILRRLEETSSVAVHVRRGDYQAPKIQHAFGNICTLEYYAKAMEVIKEMVSEPRFFYFSDDATYVREHFPVSEGDVVVSCNTGERSFFDMYLMAHAKHMILANSTFSCWAAYLNRNHPVVVCPAKWRNDKPSPPVVRKEWIKISAES